MIEDIEGATSEPKRHWHVAMLSGAVAIVSLVLLVALVLPSPLGTAPQPASPAPNASADPFVVPFASNPLSQMRVDLTQASACAEGLWLTPPYHLALDATSGRVIAMNSEPRTGRSVPVALVANPRTGWLTVTCTTSDISVPWETVAR